MRCRALQIPTVLQMPSVFPYTADTHFNALHRTADSHSTADTHCNALHSTADANRPTLHIASPSWGPAEESHKLGHFPEAARVKIHWTEPKILVVWLMRRRRKNIHNNLWKCRYSLFFKICFALLILDLFILGRHINRSISWPGGFSNRLFLRSA